MGFGSLETLNTYSCLHILLEHQSLVLSGKGMPGEKESLWLWELMPTQSPGQISTAIRHVQAQSKTKDLHRRWSVGILEQSFFGRRFSPGSSWKHFSSQSSLGPGLPFLTFGGWKKGGLENGGDLVRELLMDCSLVF